MRLIWKLRFRKASADDVYCAAAALLGACICLYCLRFASFEWKLFLVYCAALYAASLRSPLTLPGTPAWDLLITIILAGIGISQCLPLCGALFGAHLQDEIGSSEPPVYAFC